MGGYGSGRSGGRPTTESGLTMSLSKLLRDRWMRWRTYDRKLEEIFAAEEVVDAHLLGFVQKLERLGR
jgi:hypothetical protein